MAGGYRDSAEVEAEIATLGLQTLCPEHEMVEPGQSAAKAEAEISVKKGLRAFFDDATALGMSRAEINSLRESLVDAMRKATGH